MLRPTTCLLALFVAQTAAAATIRVPEDHKTIQAAIDAARRGDTLLVGAGRYRERIRLQPGIVVRSLGDDTRGAAGLARAEATVIDGGGAQGDEPGVAMAEGSTLDGFTVTNVGLFDEAVWQRHFQSQGEELADDKGSVQAEGTVPAIGVRGVNCSITNNIVHHNGDVGIAVIGRRNGHTAPLVVGNVSYRNLGGGIGVAGHARPLVRENVCHENLRAGIGCRNASPLILDNVCFRNVRAGIGCREDATPIVRGNKCYRNRRAGIGIRMAGTAPLVEKNECYENDMAGIGCRDGAEPVLRGNSCHHNKRAGIGCDGARPLIVGNVCRKNEMAGIGLRGQATATIHENRCIENRLVAIGVTEGSAAAIGENELIRTGGMPPIIAVIDGSKVTIRNNRIEGGGVAALLVQGEATIRDNKFVGKSDKQGVAVSVGKGATATILHNAFDGYRAAVDATGASVVISGNRVRGFQGAAIVVKQSPRPAHVFGNTAISQDAGARAVQLEGPSGVVAENVVENVAKSD